MLFALGRRLKGPAAAALVIAAVCVGCSENTVVSAPSTSRIGETFAGTVPVGGFDSHPFKTGSGKVSVILTAAGPPDTITMGMGIGLWDGSTCTLLPGATTTTSAGPSAQLSGAVSEGTFCVQVYDVGRETAPIRYSVSVVHP
jgi:hypothetical protein